MTEYFLFRAQAKDTPEKKDSVPSSSPPLPLQNGPVWSRTLLLEWVLILKILSDQVPLAVCCTDCIGQWLDGNEWRRQLTIHANILGHFCEKFYDMYILRDTKTVFLLIRGHSTWTIFLARRKLRATYNFFMLYSSVKNHNNNNKCNGFCIVAVDNVGCT